MFSLECFDVTEELSSTTLTEITCGSQNSHGQKMFPNTSYVHKCQAFSDFVEQFSFLFLLCINYSVQITDLID